MLQPTTALYPPVKIKPGFILAQPPEFACCLSTQEVSALSHFSLPAKINIYSSLLGVFSYHLFIFGKKKSCSENILPGNKCHIYVSICETIMLQSELLIHTRWTNKSA